MPPKNKFTKEEIIQAAVELVREKGIKNLTARELAYRLNASVKPIFGYFSGMDEVKNEVLNQAYRIYGEYTTNEINNSSYPPYKASGMAFIGFAVDEKELFKLMYMRDRSEKEVREDEKRADFSPIIDLIMKNTGLTRENANRLHGEMWIFVHGIAVMAATSYLLWNKNDVSRALTDVYEGVRSKLVAEQSENKEK